MTKFSVFFVLAVAVQLTYGLKLSVYYESLCPDSIRFITTQLYPTSKKLNFTTEFVPYGKAAHRLSPWSIRCQHGANECLGNAVQACSLTRIPSNVDQVEFVNCVMSSRYPPTAGKSCAAVINLDYNGISACSTGMEGHKLLASLGDQTHSLQPPVSFVPTVILNDVYSDEIQDLALVDLPRAICSTDSTVTGCSKLYRL